MNKVTPRLLALSTLASSALAVYAATPPPAGVNYRLNAQFTNHPPRLLEIGTLPKAEAAVSPFKNAGEGVTMTDGAGKIHGVQSLVSDLGGGADVVFTANVSGSIAARGKHNGEAAVYMTIKGSGTETGATTRATMNLAFKGATGITPNTQSINTAAPGYNIRLAPDGTTNSVERYDPWSGAEGFEQGWATYQFEVHRYSVNGVITTNGLEAPASVLVSNRINAVVQNIDLAGYDHYHQEYITIKFGAPLKTDRGDGHFGTNSYGCITMQAEGENITTIPLWIIAEYVGTYPWPEHQGDKYGCFTNLVYGADIADLDKCLAAYHAVYDTTAAYEGCLADGLPNQTQTNYLTSVIAAVTTNATSPTFAPVVKGGRSLANSWTSIRGTLNGTMKSGQRKLVLKQAPAVFEEAHELWTRVVGDSGEENYFVQQIPGNLTVLNYDTLGAGVEQSGRKLTLAGAALGLSFAGKGSVVAAHGKAAGTYTAHLNGTGSAKGSALKLKGATRTLIAGYEAVTNAPPVVRSFVNLASDGAFTFSYTNTTSGRLQVPAKSLTYTDVKDNVVSVVTYSHPALNVDNLFFKTNTVESAMDSVIMSGKLLGQKLTPNTVGFNLDAPYPNPLPLVPAP